MAIDRAAVFAERIDDTYIVLLTITHPNLDSPIRCCLNSSNVTSNGNVYLGAKFDVVLPSKSEERQRARITVANVDRRIGLAARTMLTPAVVNMDIISDDAPDTIEQSFPPMLMTDIRGNADAISGEMRQIMNLQDPWPRTRASKGTAPALYR